MSGEHFVYRLCDRDNVLQYIGTTDDFPRRWAQ